MQPSAGNQLFGDLYGALSYGRYTRDIRTPALNIDNEKSITGIRLAYNLAGFETGLLSQWVSGDGDPGETGPRSCTRLRDWAAWMASRLWYTWGNRSRGHWASTWVTRLQICACCGPANAAG